MGGMGYDDGGEIIDERERRPFPPPLPTDNVGRLFFSDAV